MHDRFRRTAIAWALASLSCITITPAIVRAQVPTGPLTLEQVLTLAEARSEALTIARTGVARAEGEQIRARSGSRPQLSASGTYDRALASEFDGVFGGGGRPACDPFALNAQAPIDARVAELERAIDCGAVGGGLFGGDSGGDADGGGLDDLPFGRKNTYRLSAVFTQNLYSGGRLGAQRGLAAVGRDAAQLGLVSTRAQVLFDVTQAYYDAALSERLVVIAEATLEQAAATLRQVEAEFKAGAQPEFEVLRARVARDNHLPEVIRQRVNRDVALLRLKQMLDLPAGYDLRLADSLGDDALPAPAVFADRTAAAEASLPPAGATTMTLQREMALPERTAVAEAATTVTARERLLDLTRAQRMPAADLNSTYSRVAYPTGFPAFDRANWSIGVSVSVPILTGGRQRGDEAVARADLDQAKAQQQQVVELAGLDTRVAWAELMAARATWQAGAGTIQQASRAHEIADVRYRAGVSTQLELSDARLLLRQAEANRAMAARDLQVARARIALLPNLPLAGSGTAAQQRQAQAPASGQAGGAQAAGAASQTGTR